MDAATAAERVAFVSGLTGTSAAEIAAVTLPLPAGVWLLHEAGLLLGRAPWPLEFACAVAPLLLAFLRPAWGLPAAALLSLGALACAAAARGGSSGLQRKEWARESALALAAPRPGFVTAFRAGLMLATLICILAVDFRAFPRRFAKTETYGTGLMDLGVGTFVLSGALVASTSSASATGRLKSALPLCAVGAARLAVHQALNYQLHVSEYGVHWNFFFTLAGVGLAHAAVSAAGVRRPELLGAALLAGYELALRWGGLAAHVLGDAPRDSLVAQNREGLCSLAGYVALHLLGMGAGRRLWAAGRGGRKRKAASVRGAWVRVLAGLAAADALLWLLLWPLLGSVSRRLCNAPYVLWVLAFSGMHLTLLLAVELVSSRAGTSRLHAAVNDRPLAAFLAGNLLTGAVNLGVDTLRVGDVGAAGIMVGYMSAVVCVVAGLGWFGGAGLGGLGGAGAAGKAKAA